MITMPGRDPVEFTDAEGKDITAWRAYAAMQFGKDATVSAGGAALTPEIEDLREFFEERSIARGTCQGRRGVL